MAHTDIMYQNDKNDTTRIEMPTRERETQRKEG